MAPNALLLMVVGVLVWQVLQVLLLLKVLLRGGLAMVLLAPRAGSNTTAIGGAKRDGTTEDHLVRPCFVSARGSAVAVAISTFDAHASSIPGGSFCCLDRRSCRFGCSGMGIVPHVQLMMLPTLLSTHRQEMLRSSGQTSSPEVSLEMLAEIVRTSKVLATTVHGALVRSFLSVGTIVTLQMLHALEALATVTDVQLVGGRHHKRRGRRRS